MLSLKIALVALASAVVIILLTLFRYQENVISGNWQEGMNIFAFTACEFLLCAMYVVVVLF